MKQLLLSFTLILLLMSCNPEEDPVIIYSDSDVSIELIESRKNIRFHIDVIGDTTNNLSDTFPNFDYVEMFFDVNNNMELDSLQDFLVGFIDDGRVCEALLINESTTRACDLVQDIEIESNFESSILEQTPHVIWDFTMPKSRFPEKRFQYRIKVTTADSGIAAYPAYSPTQLPGLIYLDRGYEVSWE